jgi:hypothetical protein
VTGEVVAISDLVEDSDLAGRDARPTTRQQGGDIWPLASVILSIFLSMFIFVSVYISLWSVAMRLWRHGVLVTTVDVATSTFLLREFLPVPFAVAGLPIDPGWVVRTLVIVPAV